MSAHASVRRSEANNEVTAIIAIPVNYQGTTVAMQVEMTVENVVGFVHALAHEIPEAFEEEPARVLQLVPKEERK